MFSGFQNVHSSFLNLEELRINQTLSNWNEIITLVCAMPKLKHLESGRNRMKSLGSGIANTLRSAAMLKTLNLDENSLQDWIDIMSSTSNFAGSVLSVIRIPGAIAQLW